MLSPWVANPKCPLALAHPRGVAEERGGPCPCSPALGTSSPSRSPPAPLSFLPIFGVLQHLQACGRGLGGLLAGPSMQGGFWGVVPAPPGMWGGSPLGSYSTSKHAGVCWGAVGTSRCAGEGAWGGPWYLHACCRDLGVGSWHPQTCWGGSPKGFWHLQALGGRSWHLYACWGEALSTSRYIGGGLGGSWHLWAFWGDLGGVLLAPPEVLGHLWGFPPSPGICRCFLGTLSTSRCSGGLWEFVPPFVGREDPQLGVQHFLRTNLRP